MSASDDPKPAVNTIIGPPASSPTESSQNQNTLGGPLLDEDGTDISKLLAPAQVEGEIGRLGHFRILKKLGAGGMGMVLLAEDINLLRLVALKIMLPRHVRNPDAKERFIREARAAAKIQHDHVITIFFVGEDRGIPFIAMEFLSGSSLDGYLKEKKALRLEHALRIVREVATGLAAAHAKGLIHRDIKPANIWLEAPRGRVKLLDFGLARDAADDVKLTRSGSLLGTPSYMSPEQAAAEATDHRSDLFSVGVVLYELVVGQLPFGGTSLVAVLQQICFQPHPPVAALNPQTPAGLVKLIDRLLEKKPQDRPQSAMDVVKALRELEKPASRADGKPLPSAIVVPMDTSVVVEPAKANYAQPVRDPTVNPTRQRGKNVGPTVNPTRQRGISAIPRWRVGLTVMLLIAGFFVIRSFFTKESPKPEPNAEVATVIPTLVKPPVSGDPKGSVVEPPKKDEPKEVAIVPPKKDDPIIIKKPDIAPQLPITKGTETTYDLGNGVKLDVIKIAAKGKSFLMGSPKDEPDRSVNEEQHEVTFALDFSMGKYEVTQEQYEAIMGTNPAQFKGTKNPVETVSWEDAQKFIETLNMKFKDQKVKFRLPSEAEWEYACRVGTTTAYNTGKTLTKEQAAFDGTDNSGTKTVGTYAANAFGLHDMHGNVYEWCEDYYGPYSKAPKDGTAQTIKQESDRRVLRGGSWFNYSWYCRSAFRNFYTPVDRSNLVGFRVVVVSP